MGELFAVEDLFAVGIGFDIAGAVILGRGLLQSSEEIVQRTGTYYGSNPYLTTPFIENRVDGVFGLSWLVGGFLVQLGGYTLSLAIESEPSPSATRGVVAAGLAVLAATSAFTVWRLAAWPMQRRFARRVLIRDGQVHPKTLRLQGEQFKRPPREGESDEDYARRVWKVKPERLIPDAD